MLQITGDARFGDLMERTLYNSVLTGVGQDGKTFFYTNTLRRLDPEPVAMRWSRTRQPFMSVFCCPPNVVRTIAESANFAYGESDGAIWINLYGAGTLQTTDVTLTQETAYPWDGKVRIAVGKAPAKEFSLKLRIPAWTRGGTIRVNGQAGPDATPGKYVEIRRTWSAGDAVELDFPMPVQVVEANPYVEETRNHAAVMRGPLVYCLESKDLPTDVRMLDVRLPRDAKLTSRTDEKAATVAIEGEALASPSGEWSGRLYRELDSGAPTREIDVKLVPYFTWGNRGDCEMTVWIPLGR
jgi:DUF1680 family protein